MQGDFEQQLLMALQGAAGYFGVDIAELTFSDLIDYLQNHYVEDAQI